jgi:chromosome segregation ATPase/cephalosporin hydroxylase
MKSINIANDFPEQADIPSIASVGSRSWVQRPMFWRPGYLAQSAWLEHIPFAFWIMQAHRPRVVVELGVHYGVSYFAFCQAASRLGLDTSCYGIDTFKGDIHSGIYDGSVFEQVKKHNDSQYSGFSTILRSTFDEALSHFQNGSIDLLHIDGMHTLDAVRGDFEAWFQKLSPRGVVLMHDTNVRERGFGVAKMFQDLCSRYPHFEFIHGHGLGVLGIGKEQSKPMRQLFSHSKKELERQMVREAFSALGQGCADAFDAENGQKKVASWAEQADTRDKQLRYLQQCLEKARAEADELQSELAERNAALNPEREKLAHEKGNLEGRLELLEAIRLQLMDELVQRRVTIRDAHASLAMNQSEADALKKAYQERESQNQELQGRLDSAALQLAEVLQEKEQLEQSLTLLKEEHEQLILAIGALERTNHDLSETIVLFQAENSKLEKELAENAEHIAHSSRIAEEAEVRSCIQLQQLSASGSRVKQLEQELIQEKESAKRQSQQISAALEKFSGLEKASENQLRQLRREANAEIEKLNMENSSLRGGLEDARLKLKDLRLELDKMEAQQDPSDAIALINRQNAEQMKKISEELDSHKVQLAERFDELAELTKMLEEQNAASMDRDSQLSLLRASMDEVKNQYDRALEEVAALKGEIGLKTSSLEDRFREIAMLTQVVQQRDAELHGKNEELDLEKERAAHFRDLLEAQTASAPSQPEVKQEGTPEDQPEDKPQNQPEDQPILVQRKTRKGRTRVSRLTIDGQISVLDKSKVLNKEWYLEQYEDVAKSGMSPAEHYIRYGAAEGRQPGPEFDTEWYVTNYPDVMESGVNPAVHYLKYGKKEGRSAYSIERS